MSENPNSGRKKVLITSVLVFLCLGGGVFIFLVFQGLGDLKGDTKSNFSYGFNVRDAALPVFEYFGLAESESNNAEATKKRIAERGLETSLLDGPQADISDWMAKGSGAEKGAGPSGSFSVPSARTNVPKMGGGLSGPGGAGSGGSQSSADVSRFGGGADSGNVKISGTGRGGPEAPKGRMGTLNALSTARASLGEGLRSDSAMTAKSKWDQGFGMGVTGKKGGELAYGKPGMVKLDHIKSGDIADLKTTDPKSLKVTEPGKPERDTESEAKAKAEGFGEKDAAKSMIDAVGQGVQAGAQNKNDSGPKADNRDPNFNPPPEVLALAMKSRSQGGSYCDVPEGCSCGAGCTYKDTTPVVLNIGGKWHVGYNGNQTGADGKNTAYVDVCALNPGGDTPYKLVGVGEGSSSSELSYITPP